MAKSPISGNLYNGGAVTFNPAPYDAFTAQIYARKQAKEEALDNYYRDLDKSVATAGSGMRSQDQAGLWQNENARQQHYLKNRDAILNPRIDNGKAQSENMALYQHSLALANQSKAAAKTDEQLHPLLADPDKKRRFSDANTEALHQQSLPVNDPNHKDFDFGQIQFEPKEIDFNDVDKKVTEGIKPQINPTAVVKDPLTGTMTEGKKFTYTPDDLNTMYQRNVALMHSNVDFHDKTLDLFKDKDLRTQLNPVFKEKFGHDITTPEDMAMAGTLNRIQLQHTESNTKDDTLQRQLELQGLREKNQEHLLNIREDRQDSRQNRMLQHQDQNKDNSWVGGYLKDVTDKAIANKQGKSYYDDKTKKSYLEYNIPLDPTLAKGLTVDAKTGAPNELHVRVNPDGTREYNNIYYKIDPSSKEYLKDSKGRQLVDENLSGVLGENQMVAALGGKAEGKPALAHEMKKAQTQAPAAKAQPKTKATKSSKNPLGLDGL